MRNRYTNPNVFLIHQNNQLGNIMKKTISPIATKPITSRDKLNKHSGTYVKTHTHTHTHNIYSYIPSMHLAISKKNFK